MLAVLRGPAGLLAGLGLSCLAACDLEARPHTCPQLAAGELVITELRGPQSGADTWGEWVEIYNASGTEVDLAGLIFESYALDGGQARRALVRDSFVVPNASYRVLGVANLEEQDPPAHHDYTFGADLDRVHAGGVIELFGCSDSVDRLVYNALPEEGSWALDGSGLPDAETNDQESAWCADTSSLPPPGPQTEIGSPGTPGEENPPCP